MRRMLALCREHGLPEPRANLFVAGHEVDLYWPDARLAVEVDSERAHGTTGAFHEDRHRDRIFAAEGIQVARVTWHDLDDDAALADELRRIRERRLRQRTWRRAHQLTSFQISGSRVASSAPTSEKIATARFRCAIDSSGRSSS